MAGRVRNQAWQSQVLGPSQGNFPMEPLASIFGEPDRINDYTGAYPLAATQDSLDVTRSFGFSASFSGDLIENLNSLAGANADGYGAGWNVTLSSMRTLQTDENTPVADLVAFSYHHVLTNLADPQLLAMELATHRIVYEKTWTSKPSPPYSNGFFGAEMTFAESAIPVLVQAGLSWAIVSNSHISRAVGNYPFSKLADNTLPPNRADQINPNQTQWWSASISRGVSPTNAVPFAFRPHWAQYVDPVSGNVSKIIVVPADMVDSWQDSCQCISPSNIEQFLAPFNEPASPMLILMAHDGDNDFSGGNSYYVRIR